MPVTIQDLLVKPEIWAKPDDIADINHGDLTSVQAVRQLTDDELQTVHDMQHEFFSEASISTDLSDIMDIVASHKWIAADMVSRGSTHNEEAALDYMCAVTKSMSEVPALAGFIKSMPDTVQVIKNFISILAKDEGIESLFDGETDDDGNLVITVSKSSRVSLEALVAQTMSITALSELNDDAPMLPLYDLCLVRRSAPTPTSAPLAPTSKRVGEVQLVIKEAVPDKQIVTGIVLVPGEVDGQAEIIDAEIIEAAAYNFLAGYNIDTKVGLLHLQMDRAMELVESYLAPTDLDIGGRSIPKGTWIISIRINDPIIWEAVKDGTLTGLSIGGLYKTEDVE